jgi:hypothetical protein
MFRAALLGFLVALALSCGEPGLRDGGSGGAGGFAGSGGSGGLGGSGGGGGAGGLGGSGGSGGDSGSPDSGTPDSGAPDSGTPDSGTPDSGAPDSGASDSGTPDSGAPDSGIPDSGTPDSGVPDAGPVTAIRFGGSQCCDGLFNFAPVDPNNRTITVWLHFRISRQNVLRQVTAWSLENAAPSTAYHLLVNTANQNQWESHDLPYGGGFLFAPVDLGWWFIAETNNTSGPRTTLYSRKEGSSTLNVYTGNVHPVASGLTRFLVGTNDATGQNEWMDGDLACLKVWNAELDAGEVLAESEHCNPQRTANLWANYPLQDLATLRNDTSGNLRHLTDIYDGGVWSQVSGPPIPRY